MREPAGEKVYMFVYKRTFPYSTRRISQLQLFDIGVFHRLDEDIFVFPLKPECVGLKTEDLHVIVMMV